jgi:hypothetical protein
MTIRLERGMTLPGRYPLVTIKPKHVAFCVMTCPGKEVGGRYIHWLAKSGESAPCHGDGECQLCLTMKRQCTWYAPIYEWYSPIGHPLGATLAKDPYNAGKRAKGHWRKAVLRVTEHMQDILQHDLTNHVIQVMRRGDYKNAPLTWCQIEPFPEDLREAFGTFDVEETMNIVWGIHTKLHRIERDGEGEGAL